MALNAVKIFLSCLQSFANSTRELDSLRRSVIGYSVLLFEQIHSWCHATLLPCRMSVYLACMHCTLPAIQANIGGSTWSAEVAGLCVMGLIPRNYQ